MRVQQYRAILYDNGSENGDYTLPPLHLAISNGLIVNTIGTLATT